MAAPLKITELWAWVATEEDGSDGLVGLVLGQVATPAIGADRERIESYRPMIEGQRKANPEVRFRLVRFAAMEVIEGADA